MDDLVVMTLSAAGIVAYILAGRWSETNLLGRLAAWIVAVPWLGVYFVRAASRTDATSLFTWRGQAEMGHLTLIIICIAFAWASWVWLGVRYAAQNSRD